MSQLCELTGDQECWGVDVVCCYSKLLAILKDVPEKDMVSEFLIDGVDKTDEVIKILDLIALSSLASGRCSGSLVTQLYCEAVLQGELAPERVISEIRALENPRASQHYETSHAVQSASLEGPMAQTLPSQRHFQRLRLTRSMH